MTSDQGPVKRLTGVVARRPLLCVAGVVSATVLAASGLSYAAVNHADATIRHIDVFGSLPDRAPEDNGLNFLVIGSDDRSGMSDDERLALHLGVADFGKNTDTMLLVHVADDGAVNVVSIPRDSKVQIPAHTDSDGVEHDASIEKINAAFGAGGAPLLVQTVEHATGVRIDHYVEIDFRGFLDLVDALNGVEVCTPEAITDDKSGLDIPAGRSTLSAPQALAYVRARYFDPSADLGRMQRQQAFAASMFAKATSPSVLLNPAKFTSIMDAALGSITTDSGLDAAAVRELSTQVRAVQTDRVTFQSVPIGAEESIKNVGSVVEWDPAASKALFAAMRSAGDITTAAAQTQAQLAHVERAPAEIRVHVLNGTQIDGRGAQAATWLADKGFDITGVKTGTDVERTTIEYDPEYDVSLKTVQAALPNATTVPVPGMGSTFHVTVGNDLTGVADFVVDTPASGASVAPTPETSPAAPRTAAQELCS